MRAATSVAAEGPSAPGMCTSHHPARLLLRHAALLLVLWHGWGSTAAHAEPTLDWQWSELGYELVDLLSSGHGGAEGVVLHRPGARQLMGTRVAGVGTAIFVFFFFLAFCLVVCLVGSRTKFRWLVYLASSLVLGIVSLVIFASPRETTVKPPYGYNTTFIPMIFILSFLCLGIVLGGVFTLIFHVLPTFYARPLSYHTDVLRQRAY